MRAVIQADALWVILGQLGTAIGIIVGIRILTEVAPPEVFGSAVLVSGIAALAVGMFSTPIMQAVLRMYPEDTSLDRVALLRGVAQSALLRRGLICCAVLLVGSIAGSYFYEKAIVMGILVATLIAADAIRSLESSLLSAARRQRSFAMIATAEAWGRPLAAAVLVYALGPNVQAVVAGYIAATVVTLIAFYTFSNAEGISEVVQGPGTQQELMDRVRSYSLPLVPLGVLGWMTGIGDRYLIGGMLGVEQVGVYAAVYGLVSRPFLMLGNAVELTFRPTYNNAVANGSGPEAQRILQGWISLVLGAGGVGIILFALLAEPLVNAFVAEKYRSGATLVPWIAGGYALLILSYVFEKVCYAYGTTRYILLTQLLGAIASLGIAFVAIKQWGLLGAAAAVPVYFGLQLVISAIAARWTMTIAVAQAETVVPSH